MGQQAPRSTRPVRIERTVNGDIEQAWELWTTREGIEAWWGPEGFAVKVHKLDLRAGGELLYAMTATGPDQIEFLKKAGMPITTQARVTYTEVLPERRLAFGSWPTSSRASRRTRWRILLSSTGCRRAYRWC